MAATLLKQLCRHSASVPSDLLDFKQGARRPSLADIKQFLIKLPEIVKLEQGQSRALGTQETSNFVSKKVTSSGPSSDMYRGGT